MEDLQWLAMPAVATVAVIVTMYFGIQTLRNVIMQRERDDGYASGRVEAKLENLEQLVRGVNENLRVATEDVRVVNEKLDAHDVLLRQLRREAKKQNRRLRKLRERRGVGVRWPGAPNGPHLERSADAVSRDFSGRSEVGRGGWRSTPG